MILRKFFYTFPIIFTQILTNILKAFLYRNMECPIPGKRKLVPEYFSSSRSRKIANQGQSKQYYISHGDINDDDDCCDNTMTVLDDKANDIRTCGNEEDEEGKDSVWYVGIYCPFLCFSTEINLPFKYTLNYSTTL